MVTTNSEQYIAKAKEYINLLNKFKEGNKEYDKLSKVLDRLRLDAGYTLALHLAVDVTFLGDVSWFYCYEGEKDPYCDSFNNPDEEKLEDFWQCFGTSDQLNIFNHISIEKSEMGVWQAYLLYIATSLLPAYRHGAYRSNDLIFNNEDVKKYHPFANDHCFPRDRKIELTYPEERLLTEVWLEGDIAKVRCCYFNLWKGVVNETLALSFEQDKIKDFEIIKSEVVYKFKWPFKM